MKIKKTNEIFSEINVVSHTYFDAMSDKDSQERKMCIAIVTARDIKKRHYILASGISILRPKDNHNEEIGRIIATNRAIDGAYRALTKGLSSISDMATCMLFDMRNTDVENTEIPISDVYDDESIKDYADSISEYVRANIDKLIFSHER